MTTAQPLVDQADDPISVDDTPPGRLEILNVSYDDEVGNPVLENMSLVADRGTSIAILGATPREQAALLTLLSGLDQPTMGTIRVGGMNLVDAPMAITRSRVALVLTEPWITEASLADNIRFGLTEAGDDEVTEAAHQAGLGSLISLLPDGEDTVVTTADTGPNRRQGTIQLTTGQRRRLALARALVRRPSVLVIEEPSADLEAEERRIFLRLLERVGTDRVTIVATDRPVVAQRADRVLSIDRGRLIPWSSRRRPPTTSHGVRPVPASPAAPRVGFTNPWGIVSGQEMLPGYVAGNLISRSDHNDVWVAWSRKHQRPVRIKVPSSAPVNYHSYSELRRELQTVAALHHPGLTALYEADLEADMPHVIYEYLDSLSLAETIRRRPGGLDPGDAVMVGAGLAEAMSHLHEQGFAHLDLRARHIRTRGSTLVTTDFTEARPLGETMTGRPADRLWLPPELEPGEPASDKMDVFSLGVLLQVASTPSKPEALIETIDAMLAPDPAHRPRSAEVVDRFVDLRKGLILPDQPSR